MESRQFVVEGEKMVREILNSEASAYLDVVYHTDGVEIEHPRAESVSAKDMERMSMLSSSSNFLAVMNMPESSGEKIGGSGLQLCLNQVKDPGNLGTIMRMADWFGIKQIYCSKDTVDVYNPKTVQSTMGSLFRVEVIYTDLVEALEDYRTSYANQPIYAAVMDGDSLYQSTLASNMVLVMGSESFGISDEVLAACTEKTTIPSFGGAESLNVAIATSIILSEYARLNLRSGRKGASS